MESLVSDLIQILRYGARDEGVVWVGNGWAVSESIREKFHVPYDIWIAAMESAQDIDGKMMLEQMGYGAYVRCVMRCSSVNSRITQWQRIWD